MNELEQFYEKLNESDYDCRSNHTINSELQAISQILNDKEDFLTLELSELERQAFSISKSFDKKENDDDGTLDGLGWKTAGTQTFEDGTTRPFYWPNVSDLQEKEFQYFENRYKNCSNLYAKTEFGLLIYFGSKTTYSKHTNFKKQLFKELYSLSQKYLEIAKNPSDKKHYVLEYFTSFKNAFLLAHKSKLTDELDQIINSVSNTHNEWNITLDGTLRVLIDLSRLTSEYFKVFKNKVDYDKILLKNNKGAEELERTDTWGAIYVTDLNIDIAKKTDKEIDRYLEYKAELYLKLSDNAENGNNMAAVTFTEKALRLYQQIKKKEKISEVEKKYSEQRGKFKLATIRQDFPKEHTDQITKNIKEIVSAGNENDIIHYLIVTPWYNKIENIQLMADDTKKRNPFMSMLGSSILDKYGNTIDTFQTEEEKDAFNFWQSYGFNFQIGTQTMHQFFLEAYKADKISYDSILTYLEKTWFNEPIIRNYNGETYGIVPIDLIKPGIKRVFIELDSYSADNEYELDYVTITDSLVLKIETLIRNFCEKIEIATFKTRQKGKEELVMEKLLDDLLADIKSSDSNHTRFDEEDRIFIKYVLSEKAGLNLRNQVAHGLMDINEYSFSNIILLLSIILKISKYSFSKI
ncbi:hypothetical protein Celal_0688 [Cellulophaga algicola DSM 14237]|uniref:DUF4209 domain-containing protein n=1 Tax=Cellulophaga algicola (strain DSM 14237 / IC166 / ACAM 630) TaxID=688270 RepID=E6XDB4_CELAD|nr:DUF4209 domain-containing protein [Cellulophaga algicola]ADV48027.1 hypothetical protein Celal_0688 [Cellulophaga algicola DSM 14237]